jgi:intein/homing endonuclease
MKSNLVDVSSQRLLELKQNESFEKKLGTELPIIDEVKIEHRGGRNRYKRTLLESREVVTTTNHKFLKVWELYEPTEVSDVQWEYGKRGLLIPIKDAKKWIKRMYQHYFES